MSWIPKDNNIDLRRSKDIDEAEFANQFYKNQWVFDQYQEDRINLFQNVLFPLKLPEGYIIMFGTHNGQVFNTWCDFWGENRCLGFELYNDKRHPQIIVMDVRGLGNWFTTPIALCWNDIGSWKRTPESRRISYEWAKKNIVLDGFYMERGDKIAGWELSNDMLKNGFIIYKRILNDAYIIYQKKE